MQIKQVLIALDQLLNTLVGGWADETFSARSYRNKNQSAKWKNVMIIIDTVFFWQDEHCYKSYLNEMDRLQMPAKYRGKP